MAMIATVELNQQVPPRDAPCQANGAHGGLGARVDHPDHLHRWNRLDDHLGQFYFKVCGGPKAGSSLQHPLDGRYHLRMAVPQDHGAPGTDVVYIRIAIGIEHPGALGSLDKDGFCAH